MNPTSGLPMPSGPDRYLDLSWEMFGELCRALAFKVTRDFEPEVVVGVARAGAIPAAIVASILRADFYAMKISRKEGEEQVRERPAVLGSAPREVAGKRVLLVDEIATSGDTLRLGLAALREWKPREVRTATSFVRPRGYKPDYFGLETDQIIVFPWDRKVFEGDRWIVNPRYAQVIDE